MLEPRELFVVSLPMSIFSAHKRLGPAQHKTMFSSTHGVIGFAGLPLDVY